MKKDGEEKPIKVILLGECGVGKTSIILRYSKDKFTPNQDPTIGGAFIEQYLEKDNNTYKLNIWDTTGQEIYHSLTKLFLQGADIVILVYSIDDYSTFKALDFWHKNIIEICDENVILAVVGNKYDLFNDDDNEENDVKERVLDEEAEKYAK